MSQAGPLEVVSTGGGGANDFVTDNGSAVPIGGVINILGGTGITTSGSGNTVTISVTGTGFKWNVVTSANNTVQIVKENGYICSGVNQVVFLLPLAPNVGDSFRILSYTTRFQIQANGGQQMRVGTVISSAGSGTVTSNSSGDGVEMIYVGGNVFLATGPQGTLTVT